MGERHPARRYARDVVPGRSGSARAAGAPQPDPKLYATHVGSMGEPDSAALGTEKGLVGQCAAGSRSREAVARDTTPG
ncbi:hypothetical protein QT969_24455, partial [Rhodococcus sp. CSLK01-03]|nr:hypothetical protein [Rhodococcus indonesiensis]